MPGTNTTSTQTSAPAITKAATYRGLFPEQLADRCSPDALESNSGPIAYLHALYQQALALEASSTSDQRLTLAQRRPDIGELLLNREGLEKSIPPLTLVINALTRQAQVHAGSGAHLPEVISQAQYPAGLPFHYPLAQIKAVLDYKKIPLFELLQTSKHTFPNFCYQHLRTEELRQVMRTATGFNPALQSLLLDNSATTAEGYLLARFGVAGSNASALTQLRKVEFFCQKTGLKPEQVHDLLAISGVDDNASQGFTSVKRSSAYPSQDSTESDGHLYGAAFINNGKAPALSLEDTFAGAGLTLAIKGGTAAHFGRMNKVIHLQHALKLPFAEVDLLLMSALRAEGQTKNFRITENTLRALGVYRYLNEVYAITAGQYAALIHEVSPFAVGEEVAFLDRVLDGPGAGRLAQIDDRLIIDDSEFDPAQPADSAAPSPISRLCRALGTDESLTRIYVAQVTAALGLKKPVLSLTFVSSLYRLSRLPRLLRVPAHEGASLIAILALSNARFQNIVAGKGSISDDDTQPDILDALIALANTQRWLRRNRLSAPQVLAVLQPPDQLPQYLPELGTRVIDAYQKNLIDIRAACVSDEQIREALIGSTAQDTAETPQPGATDEPIEPVPAGAQKSPKAIVAAQAREINNPLKPESGTWREMLATYLDARGLLKADLPVETALASALQMLLKDKLEDSSGRDLQAMATSLASLLTNARIRQEDLARHIVTTGSFQELKSECVLPLLKWIGKTPFDLLGDVLDQADTQHSSPATSPTAATRPSALWNDLEQHALAIRLMGLSAAGLEALMEHTPWFDLEDVAGNTGATAQIAPLNLDLLYQLSCYRVWISVCRANKFEESDALDWLANHCAAEQPGKIRAGLKRLGELIDWKRDTALFTASSPSQGTGGSAQPGKNTEVKPGKPGSWDEFITSLDPSKDQSMISDQPQILRNWAFWKAGQEHSPSNIAKAKKLEAYLQKTSGQIFVTQQQSAELNKTDWALPLTYRDMPVTLKLVVEGDRSAEPAEPVVEEQAPEPIGEAVARLPDYPRNISGIDLILRLKDLCDTTGLSCQSLLDLSLLGEQSTYQQIHAAGQMLLGACNDDTREVIEDSLQETWRDALAAYLMGDWVPSAEGLQAFIPSLDDLSSYFLTDVRVSSEARKTTSVTQVISSLQHYLHRLFSHLEPGYDGADIPEAANRTWQQHLSQYGTWKQWRAQINHPENLIYYANRPNKTAAFKDLEAEVNQITQGKLDTTLLHAAICNYLTKFERLSNLQVVSGYLDGRDPKNDTYYLIGKTNTSPVEYFWRSVDMSLRDDQQRLSPLAWSEWEKIGLPISGQIAVSQYTETADDAAKTGTKYSCDAVRPVIISGRLYVFWVERGVTGLPSADEKDRNPTKDKKISVQYVFLQSDGFWSAANELICLDGMKDGKPEPAYRKDESYVPGLIAFVNVEGERALDPWLTVILYDCNKLGVNEAPAGVMDKDHFIEIRDLLLIDHKKPPQSKLKVLIKTAYRSYDDTRKVQHIYNGRLHELAPTAMRSVYHPENVEEGPMEIERQLTTLKVELRPTSAQAVNISVTADDFDLGSAFLSVKKQGSDDETFLNDQIAGSYSNSFKVAYEIPTPGIYIFIIAGVKDDRNYSENYSVDLSNINIDETWHISIQKNQAQAQYLDLSSVSDALPQLNSDQIRLNTLFGKQLVARATQSVERALGWDTQQLLEPTIDPAYPDPPVDFHGGNGLYFRELFLHLPALIAKRLTEQKQFEQAEAWYLRYLFDPYRARAEVDGRPAYWNTRPLAEVGSLNSQLRKSVDPTARAFILSRYYRQEVFLSLVENWQQQGDHYYRQLTLSSLNHAWLCYQQALKLIGPLPERAAVSRWSPVPLSAVTEGSFRTPVNKRVMEAKSILESRLYNLRHGLTINGRALPDLGWGDEERDPFASAKGGVSIIAGSYNSDRATIPAYRFRQLLPAARAGVRQLLDLGRHYMKLMEDEADATLSALLKAQEIKISDFTLRLKKEAVSAATAKKHSLKASRRTALFRREYYETLIENGRSGLEDMAARAGLVGASLQLASAPWAVAEGAAETLPSIFGFSFGGQDISGPLQAAKEVAEGMADFFKWTSDQLHREAEYQRRAEQWGFDLRMAERDIAQIDQEIAAQDIEINATNISLEESRQERLNLEEAYAVMTSGFVITPVYNWLVSRQELLYGAAYDAVLSLCLSLEAAWRYEIGDYGHEAFIKTSAWSDSYKGMLAGESLLVDLQEMENAYLLANERRLTIKRSFSVKGAQTDTDWQKTLDTLSQNEALMFEFKSADFDRDYPGHYLRQLKHVSVSFVLASGKTLDGLSAILTQTDNTVLVEPDDQGATYLYRADDTPPASIKRNLRSQQQIALSSSVAEDGLGFGPGEWVYELMFHDGRYLPFEGTGAISRWQLQIPGAGFAQSLAENKDIVKDIQINLVYTALAGDSGLVTKIETLSANVKT